MGYSKLQWFFFVVIIPLIFALIVYSVIMTFMGNSVVDQLKTLGSHIPIVSNFISDENEDETIVNETENLQAEIERLTANIQEQEHTILELENMLREKDEELVEARETILRLENQLEDETELESTDNRNVQDTARMLLAMSPKDAASIIAEMQNSEILPVLKEMKADDSGRIIAKLEPQRASSLMEELLAEE